MQKKRGRKMRLPNGFGSIVTLKDKRRKPYIAYTKTRGYDDNGHPIRDILGYYETWEDAYECLLEFNKNPQIIDAQTTTFADIYTLLIAKKENSPGGIKPNTKKALRSSYLMSAPIHDIPISQIKAATLQNLMNTLTKKYKWSSLKVCKNLWSQIFNYAEENDLVQKNYAKFVDINKEKDEEHSTPFTRAEIDKLWSCRERIQGADIILVMCYSGFRISAYETLTVDLEKNIFQGGVKTDNGINRIVPIHSRIRPLVKELTKDNRLFGAKADTLRDRFARILEACDIDVKNHHPHDCRATLASELQRANAKDLYIKRILGHSTGDITKDVYTTVDIKELRETIELLP